MPRRYRSPGPRPTATARTTLDPAVALGSVVVTDFPDGTRHLDEGAFHAEFDRARRLVRASYRFRYYEQPITLDPDNPADCHSRAYWERLAAFDPPLVRPTRRRRAG
jgi:hypothetical protein